MAGFQTFKTTGVELNTNQVVRTNATLAVGALTESVNVESAAQVLNTDRATVSETINERAIVELPLRPQRVESGAPRHLACWRRANRYRPELQGRGPARDSEQSGARRHQFFGQPAGGDQHAADCRGGNRGSGADRHVRPLNSARILGVHINVVTKSGTNNLHGLVFHFAQDDSLDSRGYFENPALPKNPRTRKQFGAQVDGPIRLFLAWTTAATWNSSWVPTKASAPRVCPVPPHRCLPLNPPFFFESAVNYDVTSGPGTLTTGFAELRPLDQPSGQVRAWDPNLRPQFTQQWNVFAEYLVTDSMSANVGYVGHNADHLVTPVEGNQPLPGTGDVSTWLPAQQRRPLFATAPLITNISTTAARGRSDYKALQASLRQRNVAGFEYLASYTLSETKTNNLGYYGSGGVAAEGAYWMNTYEPEWNYGPAFFDARHNFVFSANYELPFGKGRRWGGDSSTLVDALIGGWRLGGNFQARSGFPITVTDGAARSQQGQRGNERPNCVADPHPSNQNIDNWLDINAFQRVPLGTWGNCGIGVARAPKFRNIDAVLAKRFNTGGERYFDLRVEAFNLTNTPSFGPPARDINAPNTFGDITSTVSTARTVELVFKFYF